MKRPALLLCALVAPLAFSSCGGSSYIPIGPVRAVPTPDPSLKAIDIEHGVGDFRLTSGTLSITASLHYRSDMAKSHPLGPQNFEDHVKLETVDGVLRIRSMHEDDDGPWRYDLTVQVPDGLAVRLTQGVGDLTGSLGKITGLEVQAGVGDVQLEVSSLSGPLRVTSGVGDVRLTMKDQAPSEMSIEAGVGDVEVTLPPELPTTVEASTGVGSITNSRKAPPEGKTQARLTITNGTGSIRVK